MPPWKQLRNAMGRDNDNWEARAVALAAQLNQAAEELRSLAEAIQTRRESRAMEEQEEENDGRSEP